VEKELPATWEPFETYNGLPSPQRAAALPGLGLNVSDPVTLGLLTKSHFVIPGKTRFECQRCGECCRYARKVAQLTYEPCPFLAADNTCSTHDKRYIVCKWFPFFVFDHPRYGAMLTIKPYCSGFGIGPVIDYAATVERIRALETAETEQADGAFVIHEVVFIPGGKDWGFPSRKNVDALMKFLSKQNKPANDGAAPEHAGEVHYAHHYTSGLLGAITSPLFTVSREGLVTDVNDAGCRLLQRDQAAIRKQPVSSFFVNPERVGASLNACFAHGKETAAPQRLRLPDESTIPVLLNGIVYRDRTDGLVHSLLLCINPVSAAVFSEVSQSRSYARGLLEASLDALFVIDKDGVITDVNETVTLLSGRNRESLTGSPFKSLFADAEKSIRGIEMTFKNGSVRNYELSLLSLKGELIPVSFNATVYCDADGVVQGIFAAARDIRERLKMVRELEEARNYARGLIECCIDLMVTVNREGIITDVNQAAERMTGIPRDQLIGKPFRDRFDDPPRAGYAIATTYSSGEVRNFDLTLLGCGGKRLQVSFNMTLFRNASGEILGAFAIARPRE
jgi:PAS domain S-box-containing protein